MILSGLLSASFRWGRIFALTIALSNVSSGWACDLIASPADLISCLPIRSPELQSAQAQVESAELRVEQAGRWLNPEFESEHLFGKTLGDERAENQFGLMQTLELGGKASARSSVATAGAKMASAEQKDALNERSGAVLHNLLRALQVREELAATDSALNAYRRMTGSLKSRGVLSPEQRSTLALFQAASETLEDTRATLLIEQRMVRAALSSQVMPSRLEWQVLESYRISRWPEITTEGSRPSLEQNPKLLILSAFHEKSLAEYDLESAEAWPNLRLGPQIKLEADGPIRSQSYGFGLSFSLPLWDARGPGKQAALIEAHAAESLRHAKATQFELIQREKREAYASVFERLQDRATRDAFERYMGSVESLYARGALGPTHVIEAYRQRIEGLRSRFEVERLAASLLSEIWTTQGALPEKATEWMKQAWIKSSTQGP